MNRRSARLLAPALALAAAACSGSLGGEVIGWRAPTSLAVFLGRTHIKPGQTIPYIAVSGSRGDELRLLDPSDDQVVPSPGFAFSLVIPTLQRPLHVAAGPMGDGGPDALVVAGPGTLVQLVSTWEDGTTYGSTQTVGPRVVADIDLSVEAGPGATILSLVGTPVPGAPQGSPPVAPYVPGRARVLVGISGGNDGLGGKLVVLEFARNPDAASSLSLANTVVKPLGFDPVSMALSPDNFHVYVATRDVITDTVGGRQVLGVAEVDMSPGLASPWPVRGLDARAPTTLVAAAFVGERLDAPDFFGPPVPRVYAALDPTGCGPDEVIACGVATLDPLAGQLAPDLALLAAGTGTVPVQGYRAPMQVPGVQLAMAVAMPPLTGPQQNMSNAVGTTYGGFLQPLMNFAVTTTGARWSTGALVVATAQGGSFVFDLGRGSAPDETFLLSSPDTRTQVTTAKSSPPPGAATGAPQIGILSQSGNVAVKDVDLVRVGVFTVWPGFTNSDSWTLTWQGTLPNLVARRAIVVRPAGGTPYLAIQQGENASTPTSPPWIPGADVYDPRFGVQANDFVGFVLDPGPDLSKVDPCTGILVTDRQEIHQVQVSPDGILTPTSVVPTPAGQIDQGLAPGGALLLQPAPSQIPACSTGSECPQGWVCQGSPGQCIELCQKTADCRAGYTCQAGQCVAYSDPFCFVPDGTSVVGFTSIVSSGYVLTGSSGGYGYAGRPKEGQGYSLQWALEEPLAAQCPLLQKPRPSPLPACGSACRASCEALVLARKARRFYYPQEPCMTGDCAFYPGLADPLAPGPVIQFTPTVYPSGQTLGTGANITFNTQSGVVPMQRVPTVLSAPTSAVSLDKSQFPGQEGNGTVFYLTYLGDTVFELLPGISANAMVTIR